ncbi:hypothetical protein NC651_028783 [Populus alba x Populus x berolinensis]|nr:hypothetical protein NC651_028783 [Populus alba x Populus x berolinensis]
MFDERSFTAITPTCMIVTGKAEKITWILWQRIFLLRECNFVVLIVRFEVACQGQREIPQKKPCRSAYLQHGTRRILGRLCIDGVCSRIFRISSSLFEEVT